MKMIYLAFVVMLLAACGSESYIVQNAPDSFCEEAADCQCPNDYEASCESSQCLCLKTEVVETPTCQSDEDCNCGADPMVYKPICQETGICYCMEVNKECYLLARGELIYWLMRELIDLDNYVQPAGPTYPDVPVDHEYYAAIEAATEYGFINGSSDGNFRPEDPLNRAEGSKLVITVINGLENYVPPASPSYFDVMGDSWFYDYVEAATQLELTKGYVNQDGSPTGYFGPGDIVSSCFMEAMIVAAEFPVY